MCNPAAIEFVRRVLTEELVAGGRVLEVGSLTMDLRRGKTPLNEDALLDPAGSVRGAVMALRPAEYLGIDLAPGLGVEVVGRVEDLTARFGTDAFDIVIATELLEHIANWRAALQQMHSVGRRVLVTTRSRGYPFHRAPWDYWRFEVDDARRIWPGAHVEADPVAPGVFVLASSVGQIEDVALHSILTGRRQLTVGFLDAFQYRLRHPRLLAAWLVPDAVKSRIRPIVGPAGD
jgi:hypothetical protein